MKADYKCASRGDTKCLLSYLWNSVPPIPGVRVSICPFVQTLKNASNKFIQGVPDTSSYFDVSSCYLTMVLTISPGPLVFVTVAVLKKSCIRNVFVPKKGSSEITRPKKNSYFRYPRYLWTESSEFFLSTKGCYMIKLFKSALSLCIKHNNHTLYGY